MQIDNLLGRQAVYFANLSQVRAILSAVTDGDFALARFRQSDFVEAVEIGSKTRLKIVVAQLERIELE